MKYLPALLLFALSLSACHDNGREENDLRNQILKVHDQIMGKDEILMKNQSRLDSLLKQKNIDTAEHTNIRGIELRIKSAQEAMENWMYKFQPDMSDRSHEEVMKYYKDQKKLIAVIDSQINVVIRESGQYLNTHSRK